MLADNTLPVVVACFFGVLATHFYFYGAVISDLLNFFFVCGLRGFAGMPCLHVCFCRCCGMFVLTDAIGLMWECMFVSIVYSS